MPETHEKYTINVRDAFIAREGYKLISADYREMELRLLAHECGDPKLLEFFRDSSHDNLSNNNTSPTDFFKYLASHWLSKPMEFVDDHERQHVKTITYGAIYGIGAKALGKSIGVDEKEASRLMKSFFEKFPKIQEFKERTVRSARQLGFITTLSKRRRLLPGIHSTSFGQRSYAERQAVNSIIQGTGADLVKNAIILVNESIQKRNLCQGCGLLLTIHGKIKYCSCSCRVVNVVFLR